MALSHSTDSLHSLRVHDDLLRYVLIPLDLQTTSFRRADSSPLFRYLRQDLLDSITLRDGSDVYVCRLDVNSSVCPVRDEENAHLVRIALYPRSRLPPDSPIRPATVSSYSYHLSSERCQPQRAGFIVRRF